MAFPGDLNTGHIITITIFLLGVVVTAVTNKVTSDQTARRTEALEGDVRKLELHVAKNCVDKNDLREVEERLKDHISKVDHAVRQTLQQMLGAVVAPGRRHGGGQ